MSGAIRQLGAVATLTNPTILLTTFHVTLTTNVFTTLKRNPTFLSPSITRHIAALAQTTNRAERAAVVIFVQSHRKSVNQDSRRQKTPDSVPERDVLVGSRIRFAGAARHYALECWKGLDN